MTREGYIEKIIYKNEGNGYAVFSVTGEDGEEIFVGTLHEAGEGLYIIAEGEYVNHPQYDVQFKFSSCEVKVPDDVVGIERYLASGLIKGVGEVRAKQIVKHFKEDTFRIMEEEPERLAEVKGISVRQAKSIAASYVEKKEFQEVVIFLGNYGISVNLAMKIFNEYGRKVYDILRENPYKLAEDINGVGFRIADDIAKKMGMQTDSVFRLRSAIIYVLSNASQEGHMYLPKDLLMKRVIELVRDVPGDGRYQNDFDEGFYYGYAEYESMESSKSVYEEWYEILETQLLELELAKSIVIRDFEDEKIVYSSTNYYVELNSARMLTDLQLKYEIPEKEVNEAIAEIEEQGGISLDEIQEEAVKAAITAGVAVITGGPGTGKTTIINAIIKYFSMKGMEIKLCAPTGRAAKRMTEQTSWPAQTIHRLLEIDGGVTEEAGTRQNTGLHFNRNSDNPLECDAIICDEMSMVDSYIFNSLLQAISYGTRLIMVGDIHQLPSVGAGNVLKDIINSGCFPVTTLSKIYRQEDGSDIVYNAHKINQGEHLEISNKSKDFFFIPRDGANNIIQEVKVLVSDNLPKYLKIDPMEIQVLTPMRKNETGVENLNLRLQDLLNPSKPNKVEKKSGDKIFRVGDKVMQIKNDYKQEWKIYAGNNASGHLIDEGVGVFNGDMGVITDISDYDEELTVLFDDGRQAVYSYTNLNELEHAFAITIHKSQGSEYPVVVIPLFKGNPKLMNRNLLYTAITRAKQMVVVVGNLGLINQMIDNTEEQKRYTTFDTRLVELNETR